MRAKSLSHIEPAVRIELTTARYIKEGASPKEAATLGESTLGISPRYPLDSAPQRAEVPTDRPSAARLCQKCGLMKPIALFGRRLDGWQPWCHDCHRDYQRAWRASNHGKALLAAANARTRARYPDRHRARSLLKQALKSGRITKGPCYALGPDCEGGIEGHHDDYSKPLEPTWTCRRHHRPLDRRRRVRETVLRRWKKERANDFMALVELCGLLPPKRETKSTALRPPSTPVGRAGGQP